MIIIIIIIIIISCSLEETLLLERLWKKKLRFKQIELCCYKFFRSKFLLDIRSADHEIDKLV